MSRLPHVEVVAPVELKRKVKKIPEDSLKNFQIIFPIRDKLVHYQVVE